MISGVYRYRTFFEENTMDRKKTLIVLFLLTLFILPGLNHGLWRPDEPRVAGISAGMARTNDFIVPKINNRPFLEKPPLYFMATSLAVSLFGEGSDVSYRLVCLINYKHYQNIIFK